MKKEKKTKITSRQVVAIIGIVLLLLLYLGTLIAAIADSSASAVWFRLCLAGTLVVPLIIWLYSWMYGRLTGKPALGDPETGDKAVTEFVSQKLQNGSEDGGQTET